MNMRNLSLALAAMLLTACGLLPKELNEEVPEVPAPAQSQRVVHVARIGNIQEQMRLRARVVPDRVENVYVPGGGRVKAIHVRAGDLVKAGTLLVELHAEEIEFQIAQAEIRWRKARTSLIAAEERAGTDQYEVTLRALDLEAATLELERLRAQLAQTQVRSPFDGQVHSLLAKSGDIVASYAPLVVLIDPSILVVEADVDDTQLRRLTVGLEIEVQFGSDQSRIGTLTQLLEEQAGGQALSRRIRIHVDQSAEPLRMGAIGSAIVTLQSKENVVLLPRSALRRYGNRQYVLMAEPRHEVDVVVGIESDTEVEIVQGVSEGDQIIGR